VKGLKSSLKFKAKYFKKYKNTKKNKFSKKNISQKSFKNSKIIF
jgi:hypothetical protein